MQEPTQPLTHAIVHNEGCDLHYWRQGHGRELIIFIPGGNGHARQFFAMMAALCNSNSGRFTCVTFDRRQMSASQVTPPNKNKKFSPGQQARDVRAVMRAVGGFDKAILFGSSLGGIIAFQFAHDFPEMVDHLVSHEAGTMSLLPDSAEVFDWCVHLVEVYQTQGLEAAAAEFGEKLIGYGDEGIPKTVPPEPENPRNFWDNEFPVLMGFCPNLWRLKENRVSVGTMRGVRCKDAFFARAAEEQARILECPVYLMPGHHGGFEVETEAFLGPFLDMLSELEERRAAGGGGFVKRDKTGKV
ncbi:alpha/beta-hydrolase [Canariomyces notabilis]|uniref:Alpha/beta-hydrolase n=1 Tax=Canariomyces notabilis TaxID=2074819 RepID=A0AAN6QI71_9PEZI|nr:alpha/beta-hydrolase [Canariomyces arenarius]